MKHFHNTTIHVLFQLEKKTTTNFGSLNTSQTIEKERMKKVKIPCRMMKGVKTMNENISI
jgi:hypothetical protein